MKRVRLGDAAIYCALAFIVLIMIFPFIHEIAKSFSSPGAVDAGRVSLWPREFTLGNYDYLFTKQFTQLSRSFAITIFITVAGTLWSLLITAPLAFAISRPRREFRLGPLAMGIAIFSMIFTPPIVPYFLTIKAYGLMDSQLATILPHSVIPFHLIILVTFFRELPSELFEACRIDGAGSFRIFYRIAVPLSTAALATIGVFTAIILWNIFLHPLLFVRSPEKFPLQIFIRSIFLGGGDQRNTLMDYNPFSEASSMKSALVVLTTIPIAIVYPFLQKYFVKGMMVGSIKQ